MRITGKSATLKVVGFKDTDVINLLSFRTMSGGSQYNNITMSIEHRDSTNEDLLVFESPGRRVVYNLNEHDHIGHLVQHINDDARVGLHNIMAYAEEHYWPVTTLIDAYDGPKQFEGGEDGVDVSRDDLYIALDEALNLLLGRQIDIIIPAGMYVDDVHPVAMYGGAVYGSSLYASTDDYLQLLDQLNDNKVVSYHERLIEFCRQQMSLGYMSHGVIGLKPLKVLTDTVEYDNSYIHRLVTATAFRDRYGLMEYINGRWLDKGQYISIVATEVWFKRGTEDEYYDNGAVAYAAHLTGKYDTTTNTKIPIEELRYELSDESLADLSKLGVVTFRESPRQGIVVTSGVTAAHWENELHDVANVRMVQLTLAHMNEVIQKIYESDLDPAIRRMFTEDKVQARLELLKQDGIITEYAYKVEYDGTSEYGVISLQLQTKYTVEGVGTSASVSYTGVESGV